MDPWEVWVRGSGKIGVAADTMRQERLTADDEHAALHTHEVERVTIENNGQTTVVLRNRDSAQGLAPTDIS